MKRFRVLLLVMVVAAYCVLPSGVYSCGPFFPTAVFSFQHAPDFPLAEFSEGKLGVVHPGLKQSYLFVAYRYLNGHPLNRDEQAVIDNFWERQSDKSMPYGPQPSANVWVDARATVTGKHQGLTPYKTTDFFFSFENCQEDAFATAAKTLKAREAQFGMHSDAVQHWLEAQDAVFSNCDKGGHAPEEAEPNEPVLIRQDRAYQIAAAHFYVGDFDTATQEFADIAADKASPWSGIAHYLQARALVRKASLSYDLPQTTETKPDNTPYVQATAILKAIVANPELSAWHPAAQERLNMIEARLHPKERLEELAKEVESSHQNPLLRQEFNDFFYLLDRNKDFAETDMTDWIATMRSFNIQEAGPEGVKSAEAHSLDKWRVTHSTAWLIAAMNTHEGINNADVVKAAKDIAVTSPAYLTAANFRIRANPGDQDLLKSVLKMPEAELPPSARNRFLAARLLHSSNLKEMLDVAARKPANIIWDDGGKDAEIYGGPEATGPLAKEMDKLLFDADGTKEINRGLPLDVLAKAALEPTTNGDSRKELVRAAWTKAFLLKDWQVMSRVSGAMSAEYPEMKTYLERIEQEKDEKRKTYLVAWTILHFPGTSPTVREGVTRQTNYDEIDSLRDNWWCGKPRADGSYFNNSEKEAPSAPLPFLSGAERQTAERQWQQLMDVDAASSEMAQIVLQYQKANPTEPTMPEALDLSLRAFRYGGCEAPAEESHRVFKVLHAKYPNSAAAKRNRPWGSW